MWHNGEKIIWVMQSKGMIKVLYSNSLKVALCEYCIYGKQNRVKFPFGTTRAKRIMELINSNVFGIVPMQWLGLSIYYVFFIDNFSKMTWIYFLRKRSKVFNKFQEFKSLMENQIDRKVKVMIIDNKSELYGK